MASNDLTQRYFNALNKLTKWRMVFGGWQLGTRPKGEPECDAVRDHREATMILRVELSALSRLLIEKGIITVEQYQEACIDEAGLLEKNYEQRFPGMQATDIGMRYDHRAKETMKNWKP